MNMIMKNRAFEVKSSFGDKGIVVVRYLDTNDKDLKYLVYDACYEKYGFEPNQYEEIRSLNNIKIADLTVGEFKLIMKNDF